MRYAYPAVLSSDDGAVSVSFPDVPEAHSFGNTREGALAHAVDSLETALSFYVDDRKPLPKASKLRRGQTLIDVSPLGQAKLGLYEAMRTGRVGKAELARRLNCHLAQIDRLLDLTHSSKLDHLVRALAAVGKKVTVQVADAA
jgi:antitoxin HicB